ncbi:MAG: hydratase [Lachnospiraceae bacterium]|nr:hydratase [Lachnospiraceae bacterium]MCD8124622.1 hydratase [Lachnospiraceae bacterium]
MKLYENGAYLINGVDLVEDTGDVNAAVAAKTGSAPDKEAARKGTMAYNILTAHNTSGNNEDLQIKFDKMISHDITFVGIIQTARASGMTEFPLPYVLTNCHNSLCAVGGTINEDDHVFGLTAAQKYGGMYVPPHQAVIHQYAREVLAGCGKMILGSDSHTRYGALGTMAMGEGGGELAKQLCGRTYDIKMPQVIAIYLKNAPRRGVGPMDVAIALVGATFDKGYVKNKVMEFVGPGVSNLSSDFRIGIDVMTTETTCLSSIWRTDERTKEWYDTHNRPEDYKEINPAPVTYYDGVVEVDLAEIKPMIAMPFHPSKAYTIDFVNANLKDVLHDVEERAKISFGDKIDYSLQDKIVNGKLYTEQGLIAGCAGGGYENICDAVDILKGSYIGNDKFTLSVYPASTPIYMELIKNGRAAEILETGAILKTAFCGPCFGAGDTPANNAFSLRHATRNFPNREGSKVQNGQIASVALMDARSIAATAANKGFLTSAETFEGEYTRPKYYFDANIYANRVYDGIGKPQPEVELVEGPNIKPWPKMTALTDDVMLKVVSEIHDPVTTTDELIPSGETSSYRSNPLGLAEFALSRKDPNYVPNAKEVQKVEYARQAGTSPMEDPGFAKAYETVKTQFPNVDPMNTAIGSTIYAVKPGDGSAREQAASCQKVLGAWANIAHDYATKRYRSNLINWGMMPFLYDGDDKELPFALGDYVFIPGVRAAILNKDEVIKAYAVTADGMKEFDVRLGELTDAERDIITAGCLINYYRG